MGFYILEAGIIDEIWPEAKSLEKDVFPALLSKRVLFAVQDKVLKGNKGW